MGDASVSVQKINPIFPPLTEEKIVGFESKIGMKLPSEYRSFLLSYNGAYLKPNLFRPKTKREVDEVIIDCLYGISKDGEARDIYSNYKLLESVGRLKPGYLPIGHDPGGNEFWIKLSGEDIGRIYFLDHEGDDSRLPALMSENLKELLENLEWSETDAKYPLHNAIEAEDLKTFEEEIIKHSEDIEKEDEYGYRPLHIACKSEESLYFVNRLIELGADVNAQSNSVTGFRPLHIVVINNCVKSAELLLAADADPKLKNKTNFTVLATLKEKSSPEMKVLFKKYGYALEKASTVPSKKKPEGSESSASSAKRFRGGEAEASLETALRAASGGGSSSSSSGGVAAAAAAAATTSAGAASSSTLFTRTARSSSRSAAASSDSAAPTRGGAGAPPEERPAVGGAGKPR